MSRGFRGFDRDELTTPTINIPRHLLCVGIFSSLVGIVYVLYACFNHHPAQQHARLRALVLYSEEYDRNAGGSECQQESQFSPVAEAFYLREKNAKPEHDVDDGVRGEQFEFTAKFVFLFP